MQNLIKTSEDDLIAFIDSKHALMDYQPVIKLDKFGKKKIDRIIVLTTHEILIIYEGGLKLEKKSNIAVKLLDYVIISKTSQEVMLCFDNNQKSCMHMILPQSWGEFFDFLKLRWAQFNPEKTLKVFGVPEKSLIQYHQTTEQNNKYNITNIPSEDYRLRDLEI